MSTALASKKGRVRTTVRIPRALFEEAKRCVEKSLSPAENVNEFFVAAISAYLKLLKRKRIDAAFAEMGKDAEFQKEATLLADEFGASDWEAFQLGEAGRIEA